MIYFIKAGRYTKIGYTNGDLNTRIASIQTGCPFKLELLFTIEGDVDKERMLHKQFSLYRGVGEWFDIPFNLDEEIVDLALQQRPSGFKKIKSLSQDKFNNSRRENTVLSIKEAIGKLDFEKTFITVSAISEMISKTEVAVREYMELFRDEIDSINISNFDTSNFHSYIREKNVNNIIMAIRKLHIENKRLSKTDVADITDLSRMTIHRLWEDERVQRAMNEYNKTVKA